MNPTETGISPADPDFDIRLDRHGDVVLLSVVGRLEGAECLVLQQYLVKALVGRVPPLIVVDLTGLTAAGEPGHDVLRSAARHARAAEGRLLLIGDGAPPGEEGDGLELFPSVEDALAALAGSRPA